MSRVSIRLLPIALACVNVAIAAPSPPRKTFDWCSEVALRPDGRRHEVAGECVAAWPDEVVAGGARVALVGSYDDVDEPNAASSRATRCDVAANHRDRGRYVANLRRLRASSGRAPLRVVHLHRFDVVAATLAAEPGFHADFLVATDRPWRTVLDFFARDSSPRCGPNGCRFSHAPGGFEDRARGAWLRDSIDASGGPRRHESVVYYLTRAEQVQRLFWPIAVIANLRNPGYRAWRVRLAKRALELGGYDAIALNQKLHMVRKHYWIGAPEVPDVESLREQRGDDTLWSAPPRGYGYAEYVEGWSALARELRAAEIPYAITDLAAWPWARDRADDPKTRDRDEGLMIREVVRGARIALLERRAPRDRAGLEAWAAELEAAGVEVVWVETACGLSEASPPGPERGHR